ncbi:hypothetical protein PCE1_002919 [Barthelona sp. PCE]
MSDNNTNVRPNRLVVDDWPQASNNDIFDQSIALSPEKIDALGLFKGATVKIVGKRKSEFIAQVTEDAELDPAKIRIPRHVRKNLNVKLNDMVTITEKDAEFLTRVRVLPFADCLDGVSPESNLFESHLRGYLQNSFRPLTENSTFIVRANNLPIEFKVVATEPPKFGIFSDQTEIYWEGDAIERDEEDSGVFYDDIGGLTKELSQIREMVEVPLKYPKLFTAIGCKPPKGVLLLGPPGVGKTLIGKAVANECDAFFCLINGPEIASKTMGSSEARLRSIFEEAEKNAPSIIMIDEIDSVAPNRDKVQGEVEKRITAQLLTLMDGLKKRSNVVVIAATNRPNAIDPALRRFGRFDREIEIGVPDETGRLEILEIHTRNMKIDEDVDLVAISKETHGFVGADLASITTEAAMQCVREKINILDFDADEIDAEILASLAVNQDHFKYALSQANPSALRESHIEIPDVTWEDVGGLENTKRELIEMVSYPLEYPDDFEAFGINPARGVLFFGPPGCGKTLLAKAIANSTQANFISIKGPELLSMWVGESERGMRDLFDRARRAAPCVLFFDELDSISRTRGSTPGDSGASDRLLNQFLTELDGIGGKKQLFVIGATNRPDVIDPALLRPGRLDQLIYIPMPDIDSRVSILQANLRRVPIDESVNLRDIAEVTDGYSGADLTEICQRASKMAARAHIEDKIRQRREAEMNGEEYMEEADFSPSVNVEHFRIALEESRRSVSEVDLQRYEALRERMANKGAGSFAAAANESAAPNDLY